MKYFLTLFFILSLISHSKSNHLIIKTTSIQKIQKDSSSNPFKINIPYNALDSLIVIDSIPNKFETNSFNHLTCWTNSNWNLMISCGNQSGCGSETTNLNYVAKKNKITIPFKKLPKNKYIIDLTINNKSVRLEVNIE